MNLTRRNLLAATAATGLVAGARGANADAPNTLLNVSYAPTVELFKDYNTVFSAHWKSTTGQDVSIRDSHGGSGAQARSVIEGLQADVVTLALSYDIDAIAKAGLLASNWATRFPNGASPYTSAVVFLVRAGNPKNIQDWADLTRPGISVITPNPKTSGGARYNILAAYAWALNLNDGDETKARAYLHDLLTHVPVLDPSSRNATLSFTQRGLGDVLIAWESEAYLSIKEAGPGKFDIVAPSVSVLAEPPVSVVDKVVDARGSRKLATAYLSYLYSPAGQDVIARNFFRPRDKAVYAKYAAQFKPLDLVTVDKTFGGWEAAQKKFFADGGVFDQVYGKGA